MGITNGQPVNETYTNPAFLDRRQDDTTIGKVTLANTDPASGATVTNTQRELNSEASFVGKAINTVYNAKPVYTNNQVGSANDDLRTRVDQLTERFDNVTGHTHDGTSGEAPAIVASTLASVPLKGYIIAGGSFLTGTGSSVDVTALMTGKTSGGSALQTGVVTSVPYNKVQLLQASGSDAYDFFKDASGNIVYARITYAASVWTLSFYTLVASVETAYTFGSSQSALWFYQEIYNPMVNPPTFSEFAFLPSDNATADVITATTTLQGKVSLATSAQSIGSANAAGTANASVANADHVHQGVLSVNKQGDTSLYGAVTISGANGTTLTQTGQNVEISSPALSSTTPQSVGSSNSIGSGTTAAKSDHAHQGVHSLSKSGSSALYNDVTLSAGSNVTLTQSGQNIEIASAGGGGLGINYITNSDAEVNTTGWVTYADAAGAAPVDGTGGSPNVTWTRSTTTPLRGAGEFLFTKDAANRQGQGASYDFTIANEDKAKVLNVNFYYAVRSGTYADGDLTVYLYDVTNAQVIQPAGFTILNAAQDLSQRQIATFQTSSNSTSYRLIFHVASTSASAYTVGFDDIQVGPQIVEYGAPVTDWQSFTPTWTAATSNPAIGNGTLVGRYRRVGDSLHCKVWMNSGTTTTYGSGNWYFSLPSGLTIDTTKLPSSGSSSETLGVAEAATSASVRYIGNVGYLSTTQVIALDSGDTPSSNAFNSTNPFSWAATTANQSCSLEFFVPISGWSSSVQMSNDTDTRVVAATLTRATTQTISSTSTTKIQLSDAPVDTHGTADVTTNYRYVFPVPGYYRVSGSVAFASYTASEIATARIRLTGSDIIAGSDTVGGTSPFVPLPPKVIKAVAGDYVELFAESVADTSYTVGGNASTTFLSVERLSGPAAIAASETVAVHVYKDSGSHTSTANWQTVSSYTTEEFDTHNAFNMTTGIYTVPVSGKYLLAGNVTFQINATGGRQIRFLKNGAAFGGGFSNQTAGSSVFESGVSASVLTSCNAGDTLQMSAYQSSGGNLAYSTYADAATQLSIVRVGN